MSRWVGWSLPWWLHTIYFTIPDIFLPWSVHCAWWHESQRWTCIFRTLQEANVAWNVSPLPTHDRIAPRTPLDPWSPTISHNVHLRKHQVRAQEAPHHQASPTRSRQSRTIARSSRRIFPGLAPRARCLKTLHKGTATSCRKPPYRTIRPIEWHRQGWPMPYTCASYYMWVTECPCAFPGQRWSLLWILACRSRPFIFSELHLPPSACISF